MRAFMPGALTILAFTAGLRAHDPIATKVSWDREVGPIVQARCVGCHRAGGRAPMSLATFDEVRPWARAIREEVLSRRMPKWHAVRGYGEFANDPSLSPFEVALITTWIDGGAPRNLPSSGAATKQPSAAVQGTPAASLESARALDLTCAVQMVRGGRLLALWPELAPGGSLRVVITQADGYADPLLYVKDFDPKFPETYWLRSPLTLASGARIVTTATEPCRLTALFERETAK